MEEKINEATPQRPEGDRIIDASQVTIELRIFTEQIRNEKAWKDSDRNAITVFKTDGMRIVLIALHKDAEMVKHKADGIISLQVLEGKIQFTTEEQSVELNGGQLLTLHKGIPHSVLAKEETIFLLTLTTTLAEKNLGIM
jgi:quercetin dioxygenase-like cupin family protein